MLSFFARAAKFLIREQLLWTYPGLQSLVFSCLIRDSSRRTATARRDLGSFFQPWARFISSCRYFEKGLLEPGYWHGPLPQCANSCSTNKLKKCLNQGTPKNTSHIFLTKIIIPKWKFGTHPPNIRVTLTPEYLPRDSNKSLRLFKISKKKSLNLQVRLSNITRYKL